MYFCLVFFLWQDHVDHRSPFQHPPRSWPWELWRLPGWVWWCRKRAWGFRNVHKVSQKPRRTFPKQLFKIYWWLMISWIWMMGILWSLVHETRRGCWEVHVGGLESKTAPGGLGMCTESLRSLPERFQTKSKNRWFSMMIAISWILLDFESESKDLLTSDRFRCLIHFSC